MLEIVCPHCDHMIEVTNIVVQDSSHGKDKGEPIYKTRLEMAGLHASERWTIVEYDSKKDRFLVVERDNK